MRPTYAVRFAGKEAPGRARGFQGVELCRVPRVPRLGVGCSPGETRYAHNWQRGSDARPVAAHMQPEAVRGGYEDAKRRSEWVAAANAEALLTSPGLFLPKVSANPAVSRSALQMGEAAIRNGSVIQSRAQAALNRTESFASRHGTTRSSRCSR
jgi:hypothetical protein